MKNLMWALVITGALALVLPFWMTTVMGHTGMRPGQADPMHFAMPNAPAANAPAIVVPTAAAGGAASSASGGSGIPDGKALATSLGCAACHSTGGTAGVGPTWKGLAGKQETLADGATVTADDAYLKESIVSPNAKVVKGSAPNLMPATYGTLPEAQVTALVEYIKTLK